MMKRSEIPFKIALVYLVVLLSIVVEGGTNHVLAGEDPGDLDIGDDGEILTFGSFCFEIMEIL